MLNLNLNKRQPTSSCVPSHIVFYFLFVLCWLDLSACSNRKQNTSLVDGGPLCSLLISHQRNTVCRPRQRFNNLQRSCFNDVSLRQPVTTETTATPRLVFTDHTDGHLPHTTSAPGTETTTCLLANKFHVRTLAGSWLFTPTGLSGGGGVAVENDLKKGLNVRRFDVRTFFTS